MENRDFYRDDYYDDSQNYYDNDGFGYHEKSQSKKRKNLLTNIGIGILAAASLSGVGIGVYYLISQTNSVSDSDTMYSTSLSETGKYISQRTLSLQFLTQINGSSGSVAVSSGTGWIINKEKNSDFYYIATNLHVAAMLTYENHNVWSYEDESATSYGNIQQSLVGYNSYYNENNNTYHLSMITVPKPTIVYITANDTSWNNLGYPKVSGETSKPGSSAEYSLESDFAILKYDFSNLLSSSISNNPNRQTDEDNFKSWLSAYNNNPTKFLNKPIQDVSNWQNLRYSMGGFPASESSSSSLTAYENINYSNNVWREFTNFSISLYSDNSGMGSAYNVKNSGKSNNDPIVYVGSEKQSTGLTTEKIYDNGYINGAYGAQLTASSAPGSSGSMVITYINQEPYVVGIYWGSTTWTATDSNKKTSSVTYGAMDLLNTNTNGGTYNGYNLFSFSYDYLKKNGASLLVTADNSIAK